MTLQPRLILFGLWLTVFSIFMMSTEVYAQNADQPDELQAIYACKTIATPDERLSCYDAAVDRFETAQKSGDVVTVSKTEIEKVERDSFGFNIPSLPSLGKLLGRTGKSDSKANSAEAKSADANSKSDKSDRKPRKIKSSKAFGTADIKAVELKIRKTTEFGYKKTRFFMANGQVWEQTDSLKVRVPKSRGDNENFAEISKASLGTFFLRVNGKGKAIRVRRVK